MENRNKIIMLSYYHYPCNEPVLENVFAKELGESLKIIFFMQGDLSKGRIKKWHNSQVILTKLFTGNSFKTRILNKYFEIIKFVSLIKNLRCCDTKIIFVRDLPLETVILYILKRFYKFKIYFQYSAPLGDINIGYFKNHKKIKRYWYFMKGWYYNLLVYWAVRVADLIFPITIFFYNQYNLPKRAEFVVPLTMGFDQHCLIRKTNEIEILKEIKERNNYILTYFGTLNYNRNPEFLLEILYNVLKVVPNCILLLMGRTATENEKILILKRCEQLKITNNVIFTGQLSREGLIDHLQYCDLSISAVPPDEYYIISSPTKLYESLGLGLPVVANLEILEQKKVVSESGGGLIVKYDIREFSKAIIRLLNNEKLRTELSQKGKQYILENYSYSKIAKSIITKFV